MPLPLLQSFRRTRRKQLPKLQARAHTVIPQSLQDILAGLQVPTTMGPYGKRALSSLIAGRSQIPYTRFQVALAMDLQAISTRALPVPQAPQTLVVAIPRTLPRVGIRSARLTCGSVVQECVRRQAQHKLLRLPTLQASLISAMPR